jgi:hypothetical protein
MGKKEFLKASPHSHYGFGASASCFPPTARQYCIIELTGLMMPTTLARSSLHCTSRTPCRGSHSTSSLLDAPQTAFDWTHKLKMRGNGKYTLLSANRCLAETGSRFMAHDKIHYKNFCHLILLNQLVI